MKRGRLVLVGSVLALTGLIAWSNSWRGNTTVRTISVSGVRLADSISVRSAIAVVPGKTAVSEISHNEVAQSISAHPCIEKAVVSVDADNNLCINVQERRPLLLIRKLHEMYYVDADANRIPTQFLVVKPDVPTLSEEENVPLTDEVKNDVLGFCIALSEQAPAEFAEISDIKVQQQQMFLYLLNGTKMLIGNVHSAPEKFRLVSAAIASFSRAGVSAPEYVDIRWAGQIVVRHVRTISKI